MTHFLRILILGVFVASCGSRETVPPRDIQDACAIVNERPHYLRAMQATERRWGVPVPVQMATIYQESSFRSNARTPYRYSLGVIPMGRVSSAYGYSQALDGTWEEYQEKTGNRRSRRDDIRDATDFMGWYMDGTRRELGIAMSDARSHYLAYHEGRTGFRQGSHSGKTWLLSTADKVAARAQNYEAQLIACRRR